MRGTFFLGNKTFETREMELPPLGPRDVLVRNEAAGVCGTDVHIYHGDKGSADVTPPVVLGHEYSGIVEAVGSEVTTVKVGDPVTIDPNMYCGQCPACRMGKKQNCHHLVAVGVNFNGGFAEYSVVPEQQAFLLAPGVSLEEGAMTEPLACCLHGIDRIAIQPGESVCVIGGGAIGLMMVQLARLAGATFVALSEPVAMRREIGLSLGADYAFDPLSEDPAAAIAARLGGEGVDVVIECVGNTKATAQAFEIAGKGGRIMLFSVPSAGATSPLPLSDVFSKELTIYGSLINPDTHQRAVNLINSGRIKVAPLITHRLPLNKVEEAILTQQGNESIKVLVKPWQEA